MSDIKQLWIGNGSIDVLIDTINIEGELKKEGFGSEEGLKLDNQGFRTMIC